MTGEPPVPAGDAAARPLRDCESVSDALAAAAGGDHAFGPAELDHLESCVRCRVEQARYRRLMDAMGLLRDDPAPGDAMLESQILLHLDRYGHRGAWGDAGPRVAATVAAGAAAAAGLIAFTARHRRAAKPTS